MAISNDDLYVLQQGDTKYNITYLQLRDSILAGTSAPVISTTPPDPNAATVGQFWWNDAVGQLYIFYQDPTGDRYWVNATTPGLPNAARVTVSPVPPLNPQEGALWWKDDAGVLYVYYLDPSGDQYWVDTNPAGNPLDDVTLQGVTDNGNFTDQSIFIGNTDTDPNISFLSSGSATFDGNVTAANITSFKAALTSAVTAATDVATLKSAILSAIASL